MMKYMVIVILYAMIIASDVLQGGVFSIASVENNSRNFFNDYTYIVVPNLTGMDIGALFGHPTNMTFGQLPMPWRPPFMQPFVTTTRRPKTSTTEETTVKTTTYEPVTTSHKPETTGKPETTTVSSTDKPSGDGFTATYSPIGYDVPCGVRKSKTPLKIVGGLNTEPGEFPWQVSLQILTDTSARHICGGTILSAYWVATAAHCVYKVKPEKLSIVAGDYNLYSVEGHEQRTKVMKVVLKQYQRANFTNDIALLRVSPKIILDGFRRAPICLPDSSLTFEKGNAIVTGWGRLAENGPLPHVLQQVTLPIMPRKKCDTLYESAGYGKYLNPCQMCCGWERGGADSCQGDSGGPLICQLDDSRYYLCGIVSWGVGCARPKYPGVYTLVPCYSNWIKDVMYNTYTSNSVYKHETHTAKQGVT